MPKLRFLVTVGTLLLVACSGTQVDGTGESMVSTIEPSVEPIVILTRIVIAPAEGAETIATGEILEGSTLGSEPFCSGGSMVDSHAEGDPAVEPYGLIARTITCGDGTVRVAFTPEVVPRDQPQTGSWTIVGGTGAFEGIHGSGDLEVVRDPDDESRDLETLTGTVTR